MTTLQTLSPQADVCLNLFDRLSYDEQTALMVRLKAESQSLKQPRKFCRGGTELSCPQTTKTPEQRQAAAKRFFETWKGALKEAPDMTLEEIRAERLEEKCVK